MEQVNDKLEEQEKGRNQNHGYTINNAHFLLINHYVTSKAILNYIRHQRHTEEKLISGTTNWTKRFMFVLWSPYALFRSIFRWVVIGNTPSRLTWILLTLQNNHLTCDYPFFPCWDCQGQALLEQFHTFQLHGVTEQLYGSVWFISLSNLNHLQFAYKLASSWKGIASVGTGSSLRVAATAGSLCLYFFAISSASEKTFCQKALLENYNFVWYKLE